MNQRQSSAAERRKEDARLRGKDELIRDLTEFVEKVKVAFEKAPITVAWEIEKIVAEGGWPI